MTRLRPMETASPPAQTIHHTSPQMPPRPQLALRVGVTGARSLDADKVADLRAGLYRVLAEVRQNIEDLAKDKAVAGFYAPADASGSSVPVLRFVSPLARGADRLAAEIALELGYELYVPMPFARDDYEKDFTGAESAKEPPLSAAEDLAQFRALLAQAGDAHLALDGDYGEGHRAYAYEDVGCFVVRHVDLLIALWDGGPASGRGGTAEIVAYAARHGVPVWKIDAQDASVPVWIANLQDLRDPQPTVFAAEDLLKSYMILQIRPPQPVRRHGHGRFGRLARLAQDKIVAPERQYYAECPGRMSSIWRAYDVLMQRVSGCHVPWTEPRKPENAIAVQWFAAYDPANARAGDYAKRYRSSYVWVFLLATLALLFAVAASLSHGLADAFVMHTSSSKMAHALSLAKPLRDAAAVSGLDHPFWATAVVFFWSALELIMLVLVAGVVAVAWRGDWHERSIEYRLLAELCRKQQVLAPLGRALSLAAVHHVINRLAPGPSKAAAAAADQARHEAIGGGGERASWVVWLFAAYRRGMAPPQGDAKGLLADVVRQELVEGLIEDQLEYHKARYEIAHRAGERFGFLGQAVFLVVICVVVLKLIATGFDWSPSLAILLGSLAIALPAVTAALVGIRSYAELELLAEQSRHMRGELAEAKARIERIDLRRPMAFRDIGEEAQALAVCMLQDLDGWARLFRGKGIEAS